MKKTRRISSLALCLIAGCASTTLAAELPKVADAIAQYDVTAQTICPQAHAAHRETQPAFWDTMMNNARGQKAWHKPWPLNAAEEQTGAFSLIMAAQVADFVVVLNALNNTPTEVSQDDAFLDAHKRSGAGVTLAECLVPTPEMIANVRDANVRAQLNQTMAATTCKQWFAAVHGVLALPLDETELDVKAIAVLQDTVGSCEQGS